MLLDAGEFGIIYKACMESKQISNMQEVAVKTLKGEKNITLTTIIKIT